MTSPDGWRRTTLGDLGRYLNGRAFKRAEWSDEGRPIVRIQNLTGSSATFNHFQGETDDRHVVQHGDLLVSWSATLGAYLWDGPDAVLNQHIFKVESKIERRFHKYLLDHKLDEVKRHTHGSGMVHITRRTFDSIPVDVPDLREQRRIVALLDDHLSRLDAANAYLDAGLRRIARLNEQILDSELASIEAEKVPLGDLLTMKLANGRSVPSEEGGFPVLRLTALRDGRIDLAERKAGAWSAADAHRFLVRRADFLISRGNGSLHLVGRGGLVIDDPDPVAYPDTLIRARPDPAVISPEFLALVWNAPAIRRQIERAAKTTAGIYKINQKDVSAIEVPAPALIDQERIVRSVAGTREAVEMLASGLDRSRVRGDALRGRLLTSAFSGQLTAEIPTS